MQFIISILVAAVGLLIGAISALCCGVIAWGIILLIISLALLGLGIFGLVDRACFEATIRIERDKGKKV